MKLNLSFKRKKIENHHLNVYETPRLVLGYTENNFPLEMFLNKYKSFHPAELKQIHSDIIYNSSQIDPNYPKPKGDGIIIDQTETMAIIKTADCTPLFFWDNQSSLGGILHIGWKGLLNGIECNLINRLKKQFPSLKLHQLNFFLGPSIKKNCYPVGTDLYDLFKEKPYHKDIFSPIKEKDVSKYLMDTQKGIRLSLIKRGIHQRQIYSSPICTYCEYKQFPSHRRNPNDTSRIYNFLLLKNE